MKKFIVLILCFMILYIINIIYLSKVKERFVADPVCPSGYPSKQTFGGKDYCYNLEKKELYLIYMIQYEIIISYQKILEIFYQNKEIIYD